MSAWQPIETAPKDGTWVLLTGGEVRNEGDEPPVVCGQFTNWLNGRTLPDGWWQFAWYDGGHLGVYYDPTHWQPVPEKAGA